MAASSNRAFVGGGGFPVSGIRMDSPPSTHTHTHTHTHREREIEIESARGGGEAYT